MAGSGTVMLDQARKVLRKYWKYDDFRSGQERAIVSVLEGRDTLVIMPTGGGKSLCYQVPSMLLPGVTIVVSPLISLMKDQVDTLDGIGLPATFINSTLSGGEMADRLNRAERGELKLLYIAPERFDSEGFRQRLTRLQVSLLAVDEAHCVSQWGHDFRPAYLRVGGMRGALGDPPVVALTATATDEVRRDVLRQLGLREPEVLVTGFDRRNLTWHVLRAKNDSEKDRLLLRMLRGRGGTAIVYASTRKNVDALTALLNGMGVETVGYHAGLADGERKRIQDAFMSGEVRVVVATNAFGMGIDKPDVRMVIHYNMPGTLEAYYQEAGRAGRDGQASDCVILHAYADRFTHEFFIDQSHPPRAVVEEVLRELRTRSDARGIFSQPIADFARTIRSTKGDRQVSSAIRILQDYGLARQLVAGTVLPVMIRLIATPKRISRELDQPDRQDELGLLRGLWRLGGGERVYRGAEIHWPELEQLAGPRSRASALLDRLQAEGFLEWQRSDLAEGVQVLDRTTPVHKLPIDWQGIASRKDRELKKLQRMQGYAYHERCRRGYILRYFGDTAAMDECGACDNCQQRSESSGGSAAAFPDGEAAQERLDAGARRLLTRLQNARREVARRAGVLPHLVLSEVALHEIVRRQPTTAEELLEVDGVTAETLERYGGALLAVLTGGPAAGEAPMRRKEAKPREPLEPVGAEDAALFAALRELRADLAREAKMPAYCVFPDRTLVEIARRRPQDDSEFLAVPGVGPAKLEKWGALFLQAVRQAR
jgi:ATP-dependent DNA helicase RecQ